MGQDLIDSIRFINNLINSPANQKFIEGSRSEQEFCHQYYCL